MDRGRKQAVTFICMDECQYKGVAKLTARFYKAKNLSYLMNFK